MASRNLRLLTEQRRRRILELIEQKGQITVRELADRFSVSAVTARGDLDALCSEGLAVRSHGGAVRNLESDQGTPNHSSNKSQGYAEVARRAKVSVSAVSRIAQGSAKVAPSVQASVLAAARDLGVHLTSGGSRTITFILGNRDTVNEFQSKVLLGAEGYCTGQDWALQFISFRSDLNAPLSSVNLPEILTSANRPAGVILSGTHSASILAALSENKIPFSLVGNNIVGDWHPEQYDCVFTDDVRGSADITRYLIAQGHRNIWYIGNQRLPWFSRCARGYRQAMKEADLEPRFSEIGSEDRELGYLAVKALLATGERPTALFVGTDQAASGVYQALQESGIRIPDDISVAGFNDTIGEVLHPGLTTVREFPKELGVHLAEFTLRRIQEPDLPPQQLIMPTELIRRESVRQFAAGHSYLSSLTLQEHTL
ncbi:MAG TPA: substrate-binding domain-containing protein [Candidatus Sulfotelmatobacter sp.]|nr:substrate-binding domain-containing protein [Candidatus Sulfotelmatobacter sp.]